MFVTVAGAHRHVGDDGAQQIQMKQHVGFEKITGADPIARQQPDDLGVDRRETVGRIEHAPIAARHLRGEGQEKITHQPHHRHAFQPGKIVETVAFGIVGFPGDDGMNQGRNQGGVHLTVAVQLDDDVGALGDGAGVTGERRTADSLVGFVKDHFDAGVPAFRLDMPAGADGAGIVDDEDMAHFGSDPRQNVEHMVFFAKARDDDGDDEAGSGRRGGWLGTCGRGVRHRIPSFGARGRLVGPANHKRGEATRASQRAVRFGSYTQLLAITSEGP